MGAQAAGQVTPRRPGGRGAHPGQAGRASLQVAGEEAEDSGHSESNLELRQLSSPGLPGAEGIGLFLVRNESATWAGVTVLGMVCRVVVVGVSQARDLAGWPISCQGGQGHSPLGVSGSQGTAPRCRPPVGTCPP